MLLGGAIFYGKIGDKLIEGYSLLSWYKRKIKIYDLQSIVYSIS